MLEHRTCTCSPEIVLGYGVRMEGPRLRPSRGLSGVAIEVWVAFQ